MKKHAGAYLEGCIASELKLGWRVGRIQVCVRVVPATQRVIVVARILYTSKSELTTFRACSRHPVPWPCSKSRARESRRFAQQGHHHGPMRPSPVFSRGGRLHRGAATRAYPRRLDTRQGSWRGPPGLSAKEIPVGKVQGTAAERRSQFQPLSDSLGIYEG